jgi:hypothetical protein
MSAELERLQAIEARLLEQYRFAWKWYDRTQGVDPTAASNFAMQINVLGKCLGYVPEDHAPVRTESEKS